MYTPHTVTIYNSVSETDPTTFKPVENLYVTILLGVMLKASKAVNVRDTEITSEICVEGKRLRGCRRG